MHRLVDGTFIGREAEARSHEQAQQRLRAEGQPTRRPAREVVWTWLELFGKGVPVQLLPDQIERTAGGSRP